MLARHAPEPVAGISRNTHLVRQYVVHGIEVIEWVSIERAAEVGYEIK